MPIRHSSGDANFSVGYTSQVFKLEVGLEIQNWELSVEMVFKAMSLNEITKEVNADRKEKSRAEPWGTPILNISRDKEESLSCLCQLLSPHPHNSLSLPWRCPIPSAQSAYSCRFSGTDFCWPVLSCGHPSPALTDQFQGCSEVLETVLRVLWSHLRSIWLHQDWLLCQSIGWE